MDSALWLLLWLRFRAWLRRLSRNAATPLGKVYLIAGFLIVALALGPNIAYHVVRGGTESAASLVEPARRVGPLMLFAYCALTVLFASAEQGITFTPAEVQFLFSGPFSRRQVLTYKIMGNGLLCCLYALFLSGLYFTFAAWPVAAYPGLVLTLWFIQLFSMAVSLVINTLGARAVNLPRKLLLAVLIGFILWGMVRVGSDAFARGPGEVVKRLQENPVVAVLLTPMRWFVETFTAERLWPDFVLGVVRCLAVDAALLLMVFLLNSQYLEAAAAASERTYARLQRMRSGGAVVAALSSGRPRFSLPSLPRWGGVGPLVWRQLTTAVRSLRPVLSFLVIFAILIGCSRLAVSTVDDSEDMPSGGWLIGSMVLGMTITMLTPLLTFDFRGDVDRLDVLKALPLSPWRVALGQLLAPTLVLSAVQLLVLGLVQALWSDVKLLIAAAILFALPFNFLSFGLENLMFLWFPDRPTPAAPGDFQKMGRQMLMMVVKLVALTLVIVPAGLVGLVTGTLAAWLLGVDPLPPAMAASALALAALAVGIVPLVALAFHRFDVARDTPP